MRWHCCTGDEAGVGIALPTTGTNRSTAYQKEHGYFNTLEAGEHASLRFDFGYLENQKVKEMEEHIENILKEV